MAAYPAVNSFDEAVAEIKSRFECVAFQSSPDPATSPTGRKYVETGVGYDDALYLSSRAAAQAWLNEMLRLGEGKKTIYWRIEPECDGGRDGRKIWREEWADDRFDNSQYYLVGHLVFRIYSRQDFD
jgi:hypothetical protein